MAELKTTHEILTDAGWVQDGDLWRAPGRPSGIGATHVHSATCTSDTCGADAVFVCGGSFCIRAERNGEHRPCRGHRLPSREALIQYSLERRGLHAAAPAGTPLEDEQQNTWSDERADVAREREAS